MKQKKNFYIFLNLIFENNNLTPSHISLYFSLFKIWHLNNFHNPFRIYRTNVMEISKLQSIATYHKCMRDLCGSGLINYSPSYNPYQGTFVEINEFIKESILNEKIDIALRSINFIIPTFSEIELYFKERDFKAEDALGFQVYYIDRNWKLSNNCEMKSWQAAARMWICKLKNKYKNVNNNS